MIGIDRLDYTKGILERFLALERLLETRSEWIGRVTFLQVAAPSRSRIEEYQRSSNGCRPWPGGSTNGSGGRATSRSC